MAQDPQGWAALRDGLGPTWLLVAVAAVAGFWTVHEPGAAWTTMLDGRAAGFVLLAALATLWGTDWTVRYAREADAIWLRNGIAFAWAVPLGLVVFVAWTRALFEPETAVAIAAGHVWLAGFSTLAAAMLWVQDARAVGGARFWLASAATAGAVAVWTVQLGVLAWLTGDGSGVVVAWSVGFLSLGAFALMARLGTHPPGRVASPSPASRAVDRHFEHEAGWRDVPPGPDEEE